jgi:hypothetical protein
MRTEVSNRINRRGSSHTWAQSSFSAVVLELFWKAGHHHQPTYQSWQPEIHVKKLQRDAKKYALQQLDPEDFESRGMEEAQLSPGRLKLCLACA